MINNIYRSDKPVKIGNLVGNRFVVNVRNIKSDIDVDLVEKISSYLTNNSGFPNFYGIQRFGVIRPITHLVGKYIVKDDFEKAVMTYIGNPIKGEDEVSFIVRKNLEETHDFKEAIKTFPTYLNYERAILNKLVLDSKDFIGSLQELPRNLLSMFVYAYQSCLFNKILSERIKRKIPLNRAIEGDIVMPVRKGVIDDKLIYVKSNNIEKVNYQISRGKAVVSGVLFGSDSVFSEGEMGEIEQKVIENEKIDHRDFIVPDIPYISSSGSRRAVLGILEDIKYDLKKDNLNKNMQMLNLKFELKKGCYATSVLREFMKADNIKNY